MLTAVDGKKVVDASLDLLKLAVGYRLSTSVIKSISSLLKNNGYKVEKVDKKGGYGPGSYGYGKGAYGGGDPIVIQKKIKEVDIKIKNAKGKRAKDDLKKKKYVLQGYLKRAREMPTLMFGGQTAKDASKLVKVTLELIKAALQFEITKEVIAVLKKLLISNGYKAVKK